MTILIISNEEMEDTKIIKSLEESKFYNACSRNILPKIKDGPYAINLDEYKSIWTHWITLYMNSNNMTYFDNFGVVYISKETKKIIGRTI